MSKPVTRFDIELREGWVQQYASRVVHGPKIEEHEWTEVDRVLRDLILLRVALAIQEGKSC